MDADVVQGTPPQPLVLYWNVQGPGLETSTDYESYLFGQRCGISFFTNDDGVQYDRSISTL